jgi:hypothetical protein
MKLKQALFATIALSTLALSSGVRAQNNDAVWIEAEDTGFKQPET